MQSGKGRPGLLAQCQPRRPDPEAVCNAVYRCTSPNSTCPVDFLKKIAYYGPKAKVPRKKKDSKIFKGSI